MISKEEVQKIAKLARLELAEQEVEKMQRDLSAILDYFDVLKKAPRNNAESNSRSSALAESKTVSPELRGIIKNVVRKDEVSKKSASLANNLIAAAPDRKDEYIKVKQVL
ncbi:MAG: Asp-tRNA(Asn)/Glu-tRNA(Gln) amidotransferase subunit GatC [Patescibacteria group bacterium]